MKESFKIGSIYNEDAWNRMRKKSGINCQLEDRYAVCYEKDDDELATILTYTDDREFELADGQFLVDTDTLIVVNQYDVKGYFDRMHERVRKLLEE